MAQGRRGTSSAKSKRSSHVDMKKSVRMARILVVLPSNPAKALIVITIMIRSPALLEVLTVLFCSVYCECSCRGCGVCYSCKCSCSRCYSRDVLPVSAILNHTSAFGQIGTMQ